MEKRIIVKPTGDIFVGVQGENEVTAICFPKVQEYKALYGAGVFNGIYKRAEDTEAYPVVITADDTLAMWVVNSADTAVAGIGKFVLTYVVDDKVKKTMVYRTVVAPTMEATGEVPEGYQAWVDEIIRVASGAMGYAESAKGYAEQAENARDAAMEGMSIANTSASKAQTSENNAYTYSNSAKWYSENAESAKDKAESIKQVVQGIQGSVSAYADNVSNYAQYTAQQASRADASALSASQYASTAESYANASAGSSIEAQGYAVEAKGYADEAKAVRAETYSREEIDSKIADATPDDYDALKNQVAGNTNDITTLQTVKMDKNSAYTKEEVDEKIKGGGGYDDKEIREEISRLAESKADKTALAEANTRIDELETELAENKRVDDARWDLAKGIVWKFEESASTDYEKTVPTGAKVCTVEELGGKSVVWNQLSRVFAIPMASDWNNYILNGISIETSHSYYLSANDSTNAISIFSNADGTTKRLFQNNVPVTGMISSPAFSVMSNESNVWINGKGGVSKVLIVDLTTIYGASAPTSVDDPRIAWIEQYAEEHPEYNEGEVIHAPVDKVVEKGRNLAEPSTGEPVGPIVKNGITFTRRSDGSVTVKGTATSKWAQYLIAVGTYKAGKTYRISGCPVGGSAGSTYWLQTEGHNDSGSGAVRTYNKDTTYRLYIYVGPDAGDIDLTFYPMIVEGSTATPYVPYHEVSHPIPTAVQNLDGYGLGISDTVRNYVDFERKKYVQMVGLYTISSSSNVEYNGARFKIEKLDAMRYELEQIPDIIVEGFNTISSNFFNVNNGVVTVSTGGTVGFLFRDSSVSSVQDFVSKYTGNKIIYRLATPIETDITDIIEPFTVEGGGSLTFDNPNKLPVPNREKYLIALNEVTA